MPEAEFAEVVDLHCALDRLDQLVRRSPGARCVIVFREGKWTVGVGRETDDDWFGEHEDLLVAIEAVLIGAGVGKPDGATAAAVFLRDADPNDDSVPLEVFLRFDPEYNHVQEDQNPWTHILAGSMGSHAVQLMEQMAAEPDDGRVNGS